MEERDDGYHRILNGRDVEVAGGEVEFVFQLSQTEHEHHSRQHDARHARERVRRIGNEERYCGIVGIY